jgi:hypothetical protein
MMISALSSGETGATTCEMPTWDAMALAVTVFVSACHPDLDALRAELADCLGGVVLDGIRYRDGCGEDPV